MSRARVPPAAAIALAALVLTGCGTFGGRSLPALAEVDGGYDEHLGPGDQIRLSVWREPDMEGDYAVDENGVVVLPRVGTMDVSDHTVASLKVELEERLRSELRNPSIDITVLRRVQVLGFVRNPGLYRVNPTMSLGEALALAGGVAQAGKQDKVELIRDGERFLGDLGEQMRISDLPLHSGDVLYVPERNWFVRNYGFVLSGATTLLFLAVQQLGNGGGGGEQ